MSERVGGARQSVTSLVPVDRGDGMVGEEASAAEAVVPGACPASPDSSVCAVRERERAVNVRC